MRFKNTSPVTPSRRIFSRKIRKKKVGQASSYELHLFCGTVLASFTLTYIPLLLATAHSDQNIENFDHVSDTTSPKTLTTTSPLTGHGHQAHPSLFQREEPKGIIEFNRRRLKPVYIAETDSVCEDMKETRL
ncbi:hypothetical protein CEXT_799441 [Caerostris extrusa]|uniref:Uncharacterized protein n=1 Tax=Caerostris extrusa TaxID=172846 RepID=A0AAV4XMC2_CAEEX|nr:hypothetical protein CEXT_799441 [Caerostris extrusa]